MMTGLMPCALRVMRHALNVMALVQQIVVFILVENVKDQKLMIASPVQLEE